MTSSQRSRRQRLNCRRPEQPSSSPTTKAPNSYGCCFYVKSRLPVGVLQWIVTGRWARVVGVGMVVAGSGWSRCQTRRARWRLRQRSASRAGLAFGLFAGEVGGGVGVQAALGDREAVQRAVELAVAAAVEAVAVRVVPRRRGSARSPAVRASLASVAKRSAPAISPISLAAVSAPQPRSASSRGASSATSAASSRSSSLIARVSSRMRRSSSRAIRTRAVCSARARRPATRSCQWARISAPGWDLELGPEVVQLPAQVVDQRRALADQPLAMIDEQPHLELRAGQLRDRAGSRGPRAARRERSRRRR